MDGGGSMQKRDLLNANRVGKKCTRMYIFTVPAVNLCSRLVSASSIFKRRPFEIYGASTSSYGKKDFFGDMRGASYAFASAILNINSTSRSEAL